MKISKIALVSVLVLVICFALALCLPTQSSQVVPTATSVVAANLVIPGQLPVTNKNACLVCQEYTGRQICRVGGFNTFNESGLELNPTELSYICGK